MYFQSALLNVSGLKQLNRTMNSDEALALGAGYFSASQSELFIVNNVKIITPCNIKVDIVHGGKRIELFNESSLLTSSRLYLYDAKENANITIYAGTPAVEMSTFYIELPKNTRSNSKVCVTFEFNKFTIPNVTRVKLDSNELSLSEDVHFYRPKWALTDDEFKESAKFIQRMDEIIEERQHFQKVLHKLESHIYQIKERIQYDEDFVIVCNESEIERVTGIANRYREWLDTHLNHATVDELTKKHDEMKEVLSDAERRAEHYRLVNKSISDLNRSLEWVYKRMSEQWPKKKKWLPQETVRQAWRNYNSTKKWFRESIERNANVPPYLNPEVWFNQFNVQKQILEFNFNSTDSQKKPPRTPTPPPNVGPSPPPPDFSDDAEFAEWLRMMYHDEEYVESIVDDHHFDPDNLKYIDFLREKYPESEDFFAALRRRNPGDVEFLDYLSSKYPDGAELVVSVLERRHKNKDDPEYIDFLNQTDPNGWELMQILQRVDMADMRYIEYLRAQDRDENYIEYLFNARKTNPHEPTWVEFLRIHPEYESIRSPREAKDEL